MARLRIASPPTRAQEALGALVGLTQVWVTTYPRPTPSGGITWVDAHWRNQRPGESLEGKITKPGKALTARERAKAGVELEPPDVFEPGMKVRDARDPTRTGVIGSRTGAPMEAALKGERWWAVLWDSVGESLLHQPHPERDLIPIPADQTRLKVGDRVVHRLGEHGTVTTETSAPTLAKAGRYRVEWDNDYPATDVEPYEVEVVEEPTPKFKVRQFLTLNNGEVAQVERLYHDPNQGTIVYVFHNAAGNLQEVYEEYLSEPLVDPALMKKWDAKPPARNATVETAARHWSALAYERERMQRNWARDDMVRTLDLEQTERAWDEGGHLVRRGIDVPEERYYWRDGQDPQGPSPSPEEGGYVHADKTLREAHDDSALIADRMEKHFGRKSRWTGGVKHETEQRTAKGVWASISWEGVLAVDMYHGQRATVKRESASRLGYVGQGYERVGLRMLQREAMRSHATVMVHEMAHAVSSGAAGSEDKAFYPSHPAYEEGIVEAWTRAFYADMTKGPEFGPHDKGSLSEARSEVALDLELKGTTGTYQKFVDEWNRIAIALRFVDAKAATEARSQGYRRFYDMMIRIPHPLRRAAVVEMMEAAELTPEESATIAEALRTLDKGKPLS